MGEMRKASFVDAVKHRAIYFDMRVRVLVLKQVCYICPERCGAGTSYHQRIVDVGLDNMSNRRAIGIASFYPTDLTFVGSLPILFFAEVGSPLRTNDAATDVPRIPLLVVRGEPAVHIGGVNDGELWSRER